MAEATLDVSEVFEYMELLSYNITEEITGYMGVYSYKSVRGGRKDKVFLKEILGRIRNFGAFSSIWPKVGIFDFFRPPGHQEG